MRIVSNTLLALALVLTTVAAEAPTALATTCSKATPDSVRRWRGELWREHPLVFVGKVLETGGTEEPDPADTIVKVRLAIDRLEKGRAPRSRQVTFLSEVDAFPEFSCSRPLSLEPGQRRRFYLTPVWEVPGHYIGTVTDANEPAR